jgi:hypothetical protein
VRKNPRYNHHHSNKKIRWFGRIFFDLLLFWNRTIFCQIPAKICTISPQNQTFFCPILAKFCGEMAHNFLLNSRKIFCQKPTLFFDFVVVWHKILREFGRKLCDFRKTADHNFFHRTNVIFVLSVRVPPCKGFRDFDKERFSWPENGFYRVQKVWFS